MARGTPAPRAAPASPPAAPASPARRRRAATVILGSQIAVAVLIRAAAFERPFPVLDRLFIPDDTYYTLSIARSLAHGHGPTTDGHTLTSGFQPLLAFLAAPVFWFTGNAERAARADLALLLLFDIGAVVLLFFLGRRLGGLATGAVAGFVWAVSPNAIRIAFGGLETSLAIFMALTLVTVWAWATDSPSTRRWLAVGIVAGLAVLARIDLLALVALAGLLQLLWGNRRGLAVAAATTALTLAPWWGYCLVQFGTPIPTSGSATHQLQTGGPFSDAVLSVAGSTVVAGPFTTWSKLEPSMGFRAMTWPYWLSVACFLGIGCGLVARRSIGPTRLWIGALSLWAAALLVFYGWFDIPWYTHRYLAPVTAVETLLLAGAVGVAVQSIRRAVSHRHTWFVRLRFPAAAGALAAAVLVGIITAGAVRRVLTSQSRAPGLRSWDSATGYRANALLVDHLVPPGSVVGAYQSGALSYYAKPGIEVVNLDGVVNPNAARAARRGELGAYVRARGITWYADDAVFVASMAQLAARSDPPMHIAPVETLSIAGQPAFFVGRVLPGVIG